MIDENGTVKIIDFGSTRVAGIMEMSTPICHNNILGTAQYTAPEYFLGENGTSRSDIFSLGVIAYQMLTGQLPFGAEVAKCNTKVAQKRLVYDPIHYLRREIPVWVDEAINKAVHPNPYKRYEDLSEFIFDLRHPNKAFLSKSRLPLLERDPVLFWKLLFLCLLIINITILMSCK